MHTIVSAEMIAAQISQWPSPALIGIDGLPCSGKSTLADTLKKSLRLNSIELDDFALPESEWPPGNRPSFPFPFVRYEAFLQAIRNLATKGECSFYPFDWKTLAISDQLRTIMLSTSVVVEGVSALHPSICDLYRLRVFVESDRTSTFQAAMARGDKDWAKQWEEFFLPSTDLYMQTNPKGRADLIVAGRGASIRAYG